MATPATDLVASFISHLNTLEKTRKKMEFLLSQSHIVPRDIEQVYKGLFLDIATSFERLIEELFFGLLTKKLSHSSSSVTPHDIFKSNYWARIIVLGNQNYLDWLPYDKTEKRAETFFKKGVPFTKLDSTDKSTLHKFYYIRNAIAHKSKYSNKKFIKEVIGSEPFIQRDKTPARFLRNIFRINPSQTRYENIVTDIVVIARKLC